MTATPNQAQLLNDLAVAHALRARGGGQSLDLLHALSAATRAIAAAPDAPAPSFNLGLFLEWAGLLDSARLAWLRYLARFDEPGFRQEAEAGLRRVQDRLAGDPQSVRPEDWARSDPQQAREHGMEQLLGDWGNTFVDGDTTTATKLLATARRLGAALQESNGECSLASMVAAIDATAGNPPARQRLAQAHAAYARGSTLFNALRAGDAEPLFRQVQTSTEEDQALHLWSLMGLAGARFYRSDHPGAADDFRHLFTATDGTCLQALTGRAAWGLGLTRVRQGRYTSSLLAYRAAERHFQEIGEWENLGGVHTLTAENLWMLGRRHDAWGSWQRAHRSLSRFPGSLRLHNLLWSMARAAVEEVGPTAALVLATEDVLTARRSGDPGLVAEALLWRGRYHAAAGDVDRALADLEAASRLNRRRPPGEAPTQVAADLQLARGIALQHRDPPDAVASLDAALEHYRRRNLVLQRSEALLHRARALRADLQPRRALGDLEATLDLFRSQRDTISDPLLRRSFTETVQTVYEESLALQMNDLAISPRAALALAEEAREVPFFPPASPASAPSGHTTVARTLDALARAPRDTAVLLYAALPDRLYAWLVHRGTVAAVSHPVGRDDLAARVLSFVAEIRGGADPADLADRGAELHRLLLPAPAADLPPGTRLFVVPDRVLSTLPFDLLRHPASGRLLIEERPVALAPSLHAVAAALEAEVRPGPRPTAVTTIADPAFRRDLFPALPSLPQARQEAVRVAALYAGGSALAGDDATRDELLAELDRHPVLHYAGHAVFNPERPELSYLPLAPERSPGTTSENEPEPVLYARDLAARPLDNLRLVVLSACTSLGPTRQRTVGISGLARPFLDAGAAAVVGTLWPVTDRDAGQLSVHFHRRFLESGDAVEALWRTKLALSAGADASSQGPAAWTAFQIVGQATFSNERTP